MPLSYSQIGKVVVANAALLRREATNLSVKVHIDRTRDDGKWTMSHKVWVPGTYETDDEFDDDINTGHFDLIPISGVVLDDVWDAMKAKEDIINFINSARERPFPIEHAISASYQDIHEEYGETTRGYHFNGTDSSIDPKDYE